MYILTFTMDSYACWRVYVAHIDSVLAYGHRGWPMASVSADVGTGQTSGRKPGQRDGQGEKIMSPLQAMLLRIACWGIKTINLEKLPLDNVKHLFVGRCQITKE